MIPLDIRPSSRVVVLALENYGATRQKIKHQLMSETLVTTELSNAMSKTVPFQLCMLFEDWLGFIWTEAEFGLIKVHGEQQC